MSALRLSQPGLPTRLVIEVDPYWTLTARTRYIVDRLRGHNGNRSRCARDLGVTVQTIQRAARLGIAAGVPVVPAPRGGAGRGADLVPRKGKPEPCRGTLARSGGPCGRGRGHAGGHRSPRSVLGERVAQSRYERTGAR